MIRIGLTGSIGMGKSTTAGLFAEEGAFVWDADKAVHRLYGPGAAGSRAIAALAPEAVGPEGVDRIALRNAIFADSTLLKKIEAAIHPLVGEDRAAALAQAKTEGYAVAICDIPLLFETGGDKGFDYVVTATAPAAVQRARVLERPGMDEAAFEGILAKQTPDAEKRRRSDYLVDTGGGVDHARAQIRAILADIAKGAGDA